MKTFLMRSLVLTVAGLMFATAIVEAQEQQEPGQQQRQRQRRGFGGGGPGFGRGGFDLVGLTRIEAVQKEIEMLDEQIAETAKLLEGRGGRRGFGGRGPGGRGPGGRGPGGRGPGGPGAEGQGDAGERPNRGDRGELTDEQREQRIAEFRRAREEMEARIKADEAKLAEILLPHQMERLQQIHLQMQGAGALSTPDVAAKLNINDEQRQKIEEANRENRQSMGTKMREIFRSGDRANMGEQLAKLREEADAKVLALLDDEQKQKFAEMKGEAFEMPRGGFFGPGGPGGRGGPGRRGGGRPERPARPE